MNQQNRQRMQEANTVRIKAVKASGGTVRFKNSLVVTKPVEKKKKKTTRGSR
jgi:hypothetical protein